MTTASDDAERIRRDIERTQSNLSTNVNAVTQKLSPGRIVERRVDRVRAAVGRTTDSVLGTDPTAAAYRTAQHLSDTASSAAAHLSDGAASAAHTVRETPDIARHHTRGNPIAAAMIAFGVGWLVSSMLPASKQEQQLAEQLTDQASELTHPVVDAVKRAADEVTEELAEPAQRAVDEVRSTAADAGRNLVSEVRSATADIQDQAADSAGTLKRSATG